MCFNQNSVLKARLNAVLTGEKFMSDFHLYRVLTSITSPLLGAVIPKLALSSLGRLEPAVV